MRDDWRPLPGHRFRPDDISMMEDQRIDAQSLLEASQVIDGYLLATFDRRLAAGGLRGGAAALCVL